MDLVDPAILSNDSPERPFTDYDLTDDVSNKVN